MNCNSETSNATMKIIVSCVPQSQENKRNKKANNYADYCVKISQPFLKILCKILV